MELSSKAKEVYTLICEDTTKLGNLRKIAKEIKKDHELAMELWSTGEYYPRLFAILVMDKKLLSQETVDRLAEDMRQHEYDETNQLADWLMANQLSKDKKTVALMQTWEDSPSAVLRRIFWYYQGRLRWSSQAPPDNTATLLSSLENDMAGADPEVQWAMNFAAAQIGIHEPEHRPRCITLGKKLGLYIDEPVSKGCTSPYLPEWIETEVAKLNK